MKTIDLKYTSFKDLVYSLLDAWFLGKAFESSFKKIENAKPEYNGEIGKFCKYKLENGRLVPIYKTKSGKEFSLNA